VEKLEACFFVIDHAGQQLAYVCFEDEPGRRSAAKLLSKDEARQIAADPKKTNDGERPSATRRFQPKRIIAQLSFRCRPRIKHKVCTAIRPNRIRT
jgi:hypothetical protein